MLGYGIAFAASLAAFFAIAHFIRFYRHGGLDSRDKQSGLLAAMEYQDSLLKAINRAAVYLLNADTESFGEDLFQAMEVLAVAVKADRMYIWENHIIDGALHCSQVHEWSEGADPLQGHELTIAVPYNEVMVGLEEYLSAGNCFSGIVAKMIPEHRTHLAAQGIVSILLVPIFDKNRFWGFVGFDDCHNEREFHGEEETILRSAGLLFAHAYRRNEIIKNIRHASTQLQLRDELLQAVNNAAVILLNADIENFNNDLFQAMAVVAETVNVDRVYIWKNHLNNGELHCTQLYEWSEGATPQQGLDITIDISYKDNIPEWEVTLSSGNCINNIVRDMTPESQAQLSPQGIISIMVVPIFLNEQFWGFVGFDDCHRERVFTKEEEAILRSCSLLFAHAYQRNEMIESIRDTSSQLELALSAANAASKAKGNFLSNMSHEMRTPMSAIIGMTAIGKKADDLEQKDHALTKINEASSHLLGVINDVLDMAKIEADRLELAPIEFHFEKMLQSVLNVIHFRMNEKQQQLTIDIDNRIPNFLIGDDQRLAQVITNLLSNAVKFTYEGGKISLSATLVSESEGVCEIRIEVADNGIGISKQQHDKLFGMFVQAESGTNREFGGTGLGLVISKNIVELMNGRIWFESELGKGSHFFFTIKMQRGNKSPRSLLAPGVNWENVRVLAVDDMAEILNQFQDIFNRIDIQCDLAADAHEAMRMIEEHGEYDIYFIDWNMPGMDGIELTRHIKSCEDGRPCVVIMITAMDWDRIRDEAHLAGVDKRLIKPLSSSVIIDCINGCFGAVPDDDRTQDNFKFVGKKLLVADDVEINREILVALLEETGLIIECAENGAEAFDMVAAAPRKYDIVFMDVQMPRMDGLEATRRIRTLPGCDKGVLPIIAMTANVFKSDIEECLDAGMDGHLGKPFDIDKVLEVLQQYLHI